jgi:putative ABC transport system permease protein
MQFLTQMSTVLRLTFSTLPQRRGAASVIVIGMACVVTVFVSLQALSAGILHMIDAGSRPDRAIVVAKGAAGMVGSAIGRADAPTIMDLPGVKRGADGKPVASVSVVSGFATTKKSDGLIVYTNMRGVSPDALQVWPEWRLVAGRMYQPGLRELIVGQGAQTQFEGLNIGDQVLLPGGDWTVVGVFSSDGGANDTELVGDADTLMSATLQPNFNAVTVLLDSPASFEPFRDAVRGNPTLTLDVWQESAFYAQQYKFIIALFRAVGIGLSALMAVGAVFGALNTMYAAVADRQREIATLRALGFRSAAIVIPVLTEAVLLATAGAVLGALIAAVAFGGTDHILNGLQVRLTVTPAIVALGIGLACFVAFLGGLFPAIRAARMPIVDALRAS